MVFPRVLDHLCPPTSCCRIRKWKGGFNTNCHVYNEMQMCKLCCLQLMVAVFSIMVEKWEGRILWAAANLRQINGFRRFSAAVRRLEEKFDLFSLFTHVSLCFLSDLDRIIDVWAKMLGDLTSDPAPSPRLGKCEHWFNPQIWGGQSTPCPQDPFGEMWTLIQPSTKTCTSASSPARFLTECSVGFQSAEKK